MDLFVDRRKKEYFNDEGADRPLRSPVGDGVIQDVRSYRKCRIVEQILVSGAGALLLYDPLNIRNAIDVSNMQLWATHNAFRHVLIFADGYTIEFEFAGSEHLGDGRAEVDEVRPGISWFYFAAGGQTESKAEEWADEITALLRQRGVADLPLAVDTLAPLGLDKLRQRGTVIQPGQPLTELARSVKSDSELKLVNWTIRVAEAGMARIYEVSEPGRTEQEIWAELHHENIRSGGEWIETRLLSAGQRTNPWWNEASDYVCKAGELISFDTDMIGPYGYCADLSRSWTIGHTKMTGEQRSLYGAALEQIEHNMALLESGLSFVEFNAKSWKIPEKYVANRYPHAVHGVGLCDEYPNVPTHIDFTEAYMPGGTFEENMVVCVESLIGARGGAASVKLESQVLISSTGSRRLETFPYEDLDFA